MPHLRCRCVWTLVCCRNAAGFHEVENTLSVGEVNRQLQSLTIIFDLRLSNCPSCIIAT
jgi:hypothetical protein